VYLSHGYQINLYFAGNRKCPAAYCFFVNYKDMSGNNKEGNKNSVGNSKKQGNKEPKK